MTWSRFAMLYRNSLQTETGTNFIPQGTSLLRLRWRLPNCDGLIEPRGGTHVTSRCKTC